MRTQGPPPTPPSPGRPSSPPLPWAHAVLCWDCLEAIEERAAILEYDADFERAAAERAVWDLFRADGKCLSGEATCQAGK